MALQLVTGYKGTPHITADSVGSFNAGIVGTGEIVLNTGNQMSASLISNNTVRILDGDAVIQGRHITLKKDTYEEMTINNGTIGMNRNDLIVIRYTLDAVSGVENAEFAIIQGEETSGTASDPQYTTGDILSGGCALHEMPLYRIPLTELAVGTPEPLFRTIGTTDNGLLFRGWNPVSSVEEDTPEKWRELGSGIWIIDLPNIITGQPSQWGFLYNTAYAEEVAQKFIVQASGETFRRNANGIGWYGTDWRSGEWGEVYDSLNPVFKSGVYSGDEQPSQFINLGFTPSTVLVMRSDGLSVHIGEAQRADEFWGGIALKDKPCTVWAYDKDNLIITIEENGFRVYYQDVTGSGQTYKICSNAASNFHYIAYK